MSQSNHWKVLEEQEVLKLGYFRIRQEKCELPDGRVMPRYLIVEFNSWVHTLAITSDGMVVCVDQYRHARQNSYLELPGGAAEPHKGETEMQSALRELTEETGYSGDISFIATHDPNPALQNNAVHLFLVENCTKVSEPQWDPYEDMEVKLIPVKELYERAERGEVQHSLMLSSLFMARPLLQQKGYLD